MRRDRDPDLRRDRRVRREAHEADRELLRRLVVCIVHEVPRGPAREPRDLRRAVRERRPGLVAARGEVPEAKREAHGRLGPARVVAPCVERRSKRVRERVESVAMPVQRAARPLVQRQLRERARRVEHDICVALEGHEERSERPGRAAGLERLERAPVAAQVPERAGGLGREARHVPRRRPRRAGARHVARHAGDARRREAAERGLVVRQVLERAGAVHQRFDVLFRSALQLGRAARRVPHESGHDLLVEEQRVVGGRPRHVERGAARNERGFGVAGQVPRPVQELRRFPRHREARPHVVVREGGGERCEHGAPTDRIT